MLHPDDEERFVRALGLIYAAIPWAKIRTSKNPWDVWNHRIRAASTRPTLGEFASRLANCFGLQQIPMEAVDILETLRPRAAALLDLAYREHIPIAMRAVQVAKKLKAARAEKPATQLTLEVPS